MAVQFIFLLFLAHIFIVSSTVPPFHRFCGVRNDLGSCQHVRAPSLNEILASPHMGYGDLNGDHIHQHHMRLHQHPMDHRTARFSNLDNRHFLDMFLHENDNGGPVSPLDIPLDASYTHHPNRWEWND